MKLQFHSSIEAEAGRHAAIEAINEDRSTMHASLAMSLEPEDGEALTVTAESLTAWDAASGKWNECGERVEALTPAGNRVILWRQVQPFAGSRRRDVVLFEAGNYNLIFGMDA